MVQLLAKCYVLFITLVQVVVVTLQLGQNETTHVLTKTTIDDMLVVSNDLIWQVMIRPEGCR